MVAVAIKSGMKDGRLQVHIDIKFNSNHGPDGRFVGYGPGGAIQTPSGAPVFMGPGGAVPDAPKYSKMSGKEVASEIQELVKSSAERKKKEKTKRKELKLEYQKVERERNTLPKVGSEQEIAAAREERTATYSEYGSFSPQYKEAAERYSVLDSPKDGDAFARLEKKTRRASDAAYEFDVAAKDATRAEKEKVLGMLKLDPEDRSTTRIRGDTGNLSRKKIQSGVDLVNEIVHKDVLGKTTFAVREVKGQRPSYEDGVMKIAKKDGMKVVAHELGHHIEHGNSAATRAAVEFRRSVTSGAKVERLNTVNKTYRPDELYRKRTDGNKWIDPYMGKMYGQGDTEIISMGLELLASKPMDFAAKDPKMFEFVVSVVRGDF